MSIEIANLTDTQRKFLAKYSENKSTIDDALKYVGVERNHFNEWLIDSSFNLKYREIGRIKTEAIKQENNILALQNLNNQLREGSLAKTTHKTITKTQLDKNGDEFEATETHFTVERVPLPPATLKLALQESTLVAAITQLANEGVLTPSQYQRLMAVSEQYQVKAAEVFKEDKTLADDQESSMERAKNYLKYQLMGIMKDAEVIE